MQPTINVNVDITPAQIQPDSANKLQVTIDTPNPTSVTEFESGDTVVKGNNLTVFTRETTTIDGINNELASIDAQITSLTDRKNFLTGILPNVQTATTNAITELQSRPQIASPSTPDSVLVSSPSTTLTP